MESTATHRIWHKGPPPHVGWWNASNVRFLPAWRWWNGSAWCGRPSFSYTSAGEAAGRTARLHPQTEHIEWSDYWPEGARVPRIDPGVGSIVHDGITWIIDAEGTPRALVPLLRQAQWKEWAEQRNAKPYEHTARDAVNKVFNAIHGRTRMVDGDALAQLAMDAERLAKRLRTLSNSAC